VLAEAGFEWNDSGAVADGDGRLVAVLYEADPLDFLRRYPQTRLDESYGDQWPAPCVDLWLKFDWDAGRAELDLEGFEVLDDLDASGREGLAQRVAELSGDVNEDAHMIATGLALVLGVSPPGPSPGAPS
jgi:hypothetical protein